MKDYPFAKAILDKTEGGLQIILDYYPDASIAVQNTSKKFKRRTEEKTASSSLKRAEDGTWLLCDWGAWDKPKNAIGICMLEEGLSFGEACSKLAKLYNVTFQGVQHVAKPVISKRERKEGEVPGTYLFAYKEELSKAELAVIGPTVTNAIAKRFNLKSVTSFSYVKEKEVVVSESTDTYPIFVYDFGEWQKIYQPKSADKGYRFRYAGKRPSDYVFGLLDAEKTQKRIKDAALKKVEEDQNPKDEELKIDKTKWR